MPNQAALYCLFRQKSVIIRTNHFKTLGKNQMKKCPLCNQFYSDDNVFCMNDGTTLLLVSDTGANPFVIPTGDNQTTQVVSRPQFSVQIPIQNAPKDNSKWLFMVIGILLASVVGMGAFMLTRGGEKDEKKENVNQNAKTENTPTENTNRAENDLAKNTPKTNPTAEQPKINPNLNPAGSWSGHWNSTGTYRTYFTASVNLTDEGGGRMSGSIVWNLQSTNNPKKTDKVGTSATEYVQGVYNPANRRVTLRGVRKDDPYDIIIYDSYTLTLAENNLTMNGRSKGGNFSLKR